MKYASLEDFLSQGKAALAKGPIAMIFVEDEVEVASTLRHHLQLGFKAVLALMPDRVALAADLVDAVHRIPYDPLDRDGLPRAVNAINDAAPGIWVYYCYNAEYLFYPFAESRSVGEMLAFNTEERRDTILTFVVDLYAIDLHKHPSAVSLEDAHLDKSGYYALARKDEWNNALDRQMDFFGGLRWRYEEHIPEAARRIDRVGIFRAKPGLQLLQHHTFNDPEYNTYACPWHHNLTASIASFRTAKALKRNPGSTFDIETFRWHNSIPFEWDSRQLLELGLMEPGQWF